MHFRFFHSFKKKIIAIAILPIIGSCLCGLSLSGTKDYKFDHIGYALTDYNKMTYYNGYVQSIVNIYKKPIESENQFNFYNDIFETYYYNSMVGNLRQPLNNTIVDSDNNSLKLFTQKTLSIRNELLEDGGHYLDYGLFAAYYADDILGVKGYLNPRFGADSFVYISDTYADKLLEKYGITTYEDLIQKEEYAVLNLKVDGQTETKVSINNILYHDKREATRTYELYGDFAVIYNFRPITNWSDISIEMDLKIDPYGVKNVLKTIDAYGYKGDNSTVTFKSYDYTNKVYIDNQKANDLYVDAYASNHNAIAITGFVILLVLFGGILSYLYLTFVKEKKEILFLLFSWLFVFALYGIIVTFTYNYPLFSVAPIAFTILMFIIFGKELWSYVKPRIKKMDSHSETINL